MLAIVHIRGTYAKSSFHETTSGRKKPASSVRLALVAVFAALIALLTIFSIPFPPPLYELTLAPAVYFAFSVMVDPWTAFSAIAVGSFVGETYNIASRGGLPIFIAGIVWARAPEALIISRARGKSWKAMAGIMVLATVYETLAFFIPDWLFYTYGLFSYGSPTDAVTGFYAALPDLLTILDAAFIPIALVIMKTAGPRFRQLGFVESSKPSPV
jgi:hypothetical protein